MTDKWIEDSLTLGGKEIPVKRGFIEQRILQFYPENPRLYSIVNVGDEEPDQTEIFKKLSKLDHVKQLVQSIRANGGLTDPIIVREEDWVVLEGNSRLAAYRLLAERDAIKWGKMKCIKLPKDVGEDLIFTLLGEYHIIGRKDWAPYEQAGYLYRRNVVHQIDANTIASEMGLSTRIVNHLIYVYSFMVDQGENDVKKWSYYEEYLKHNATKRARQKHPEFDSVVVSKIKSGEIQKAIDVREKLTVIATDRGNVMKSFLSGSLSFEECHERAAAKGIDDVWLKRLKRFRDQISSKECHEELQQLRGEKRKRCQYELKKIDRALKSVLEYFQ